MVALAALGAVHSAYVVLLRSLISLAIFLSVACSIDRVYKVGVFFKHRLKELLTGKRPEHDFSCRPLPDPASYALVFPKVSYVVFFLLSDLKKNVVDDGLALLAERWKKGICPRALGPHQTF